MPAIKNYDEKLLVVISPWPPSGPKHKQFINNISTWFELMLRVDNLHAALKVEAIYQQRTHPNIIVELPAEARIEHLLGAHHWDRILREPFGSKYREEVSYVYEYKYDTFRHPSRINWHASIPTYTAIDPAFPILHPYPLPGPAPAPRLPYAANLPKHLRSGTGSATQTSSLLEQNADLKENWGKRIHTLKEAYPLSELFRLTNLFDPSEEELVKILHSRYISEAGTVDSPSTSSNGKEVHVKLEPTTDDYEPSPRLVTMLSRIQPHVMTNPRPRATGIKHEEDYNPSEKLQAVISTFESSPTGKRAFRVKQEPEESEKGGSWLRRSDDG
ncbi:hypothetical protein AX15_004963 [Amanita polypyramis BW_CC]|nr:hypothetical protein AX15_004963 [Amanita polypyramis BW_CC]